MSRGYPKDPSNKEENIILVGKVVGIHGIKGEVKILPYGNCEKKKWKTLYLKKGPLQKKYEIKGLRPHKGVILAFLLGCDTINIALELIGSEVLIEKSQLPKLPKGEYYHFDLIGMEVFTEDNIFLGVLDDIFSTGSNDVYVVKDNIREMLIPATENVVVDIDLKKRQMVIRLVEGLMP